MYKKKSDCYDWDSTDEVGGEDKVRLYNSQENVHLLNLFCGINFSFVTFEGKRYYILGR